MTEMYEQIDSHVNDALDRQVWQYKGKTNFDQLITAHAERMQYLENALYDLLTKRSISTASGIQLDNNGEYLDVEREGLGDEPYRTKLLTAASKLRKSGQVDALISTLSNITGKTVKLIQSFPGVVYMYILVSDWNELTDEENIVDTMEGVKAAGIKLVISKQNTTHSQFIFSSNVNGGASGQGFATLADGSDGGSFASVI